MRIVKLSGVFRFGFLSDLSKSSETVDDRVAYIVSYLCFLVNCVILWLFGFSVYHFNPIGL